MTNESISTKRYSRACGNQLLGFEVQQKYDEQAEDA